MRYKKTREIPAKTDEYIARANCDVCKTEIEKRNYGNYHYAEISCSEGTNYPEGGNKKRIFFDMCPECFHKKLVPFLTYLEGNFSPLGIEQYDEDYDW